MASEPTPTVYLPIETLSRELDARLLLASRLLRQRIPVVIGQQWLINQNLANGYPPGWVLLKGLNRIQAGVAIHLSKLGNVVMACDEEALGLSYETFMSQDIFPDTAPYYASVFAQGDFHRKVVMKRTGCRPEQVITVGNARLDLLKPRFRKIYDAEVAEIRERLGEFVLFNTNTGYVHSVWESEEEQERVLIRIGWLDKAKPETYDLYRRIVALDYSNYDLTRTTVRGLATADPSIKIVVRPHPAENTGAWLTEFTDLPNVEVVREGGIAPMLLAARLVLHTGCTTGVEATLLNRPTMSILPDDPKQDQWQWFVANHIVPTAVGAVEAEEKVRAFLAGMLDLESDRQAERHAARDLYFSGLDGDFVFDVKAETILKQIRDHKLLDAQYAWAPKDPQKVLTTMERSEYFRRKMSISLEEITERYRFLLHHARGGRPTRIRQLGDSVFLFENSETV